MKYALNNTVHAIALLARTSKINELFAEDVPENAVTIENGTHFAERFDLKEEVGK